MRRLSLTLGLTLLLLHGVFPALAEDLELFGGERFQGLPWRLKADKVTYEFDRRTYVAEGRVEITQGERRLAAQRVELNEQTKVARLEGHVVMVLGEDILTGREGFFNLATRAGEIRDARLFLKKNHFHVNSALIRKTGDQTFVAENATITTCDADIPVWSFSVRRVEVEVKGYGTTQGNVLRLAGVPVFYAPMALFPILTERQSGFLLPFFSSQKLGGFVVEVPFYWVINNHADATFYQNYLAKRGYQQGLNFRWQGFGGAALDFQGAYLSDRGEGVATSNRYWVAGMARHPLGDSWEARLTLDRVSDFEYLKNFNYGNLGLSTYSRDLLGDFGRNLEPQEVQNRVSTGLITGSFPWGAFTAYARYYQTLVSDIPRPYHRLPALALDTLILPLGSLPFSFGLQSSYGHFYRTDSQTGQKVDLHPMLWWQAQPLPGVFWNSQVGVRETLFHLDRHAPDGISGDNLFRTLYDVKLALSGLVYRDYGRTAESPSFYRHFLRPEITYWNMPRYTARRYPDFDPFDQGWVVNVTRNLPVREGDAPLGGVNALTYGFSSNLLQRGEVGEGQAVVRDLFWFRLTHGVFFTSSSMAMDGTDLKHHRFADIYAESEIYPFKGVALGLNVGVSPYSEGFNRADVKMVFFDNQRNNYFNIGYLYLKDFANQINVTAALDLLPSLKTYFQISHTFFTDKRLEQQYGIVLQRQCWGLAFSFTTLPNDNRFSFSFILPGLIDKFKKPPVNVPERTDLR